MEAGTKMKRFPLFAFLFLAACSLTSYGFGGLPTSQQSETEIMSAGGSVYLIDNFENGDMTTNPLWWKFDNIKPVVVTNDNLQMGDPVSLNEIKRYSLNITGSCRNWYCGGIGVYTAKRGEDVSKFNTFQMDVYGNGPGSGTIKIELYDDDNGNWQIEEDPNKNYAPLYDDVFIYNLTVDWRGWKRVDIPIADFIDGNPGVGDDIWNPNQQGGSGGFIQMQLIFIGSKKAGTVRYNIDNVALTIK